MNVKSPLMAIAVVLAVGQLSGCALWQRERTDEAAYEADIDAQNQATWERWENLPTYKQVDPQFAPDFRHY